MTSAERRGSEVSFGQLVRLKELAFEKAASSIWRSWQRDESHLKSGKNGDEREGKKKS